MEVEAGAGQCITPLEERHPKLTNPMDDYRSVEISEFPARRDVLEEEQGGTTT